MAARYSKAFRSKEESTTSIARVYADINEKRPPDYWDYENFNVQVTANLQDELHSESRAEPAIFCSGVIKTTMRWSGRLEEANTAKSLK
jgi:hypothetical protein